MTVKEMREFLNSLDNTYDDKEVHPAGDVTAYHFINFEERHQGWICLYVGKTEEEKYGSCGEFVDERELPHHWFLD